MKLLRMAILMATTSMVAAGLLVLLAEPAEALLMGAGLAGLASVARY